MEIKLRVATEADLSEILRLYAHLEINSAAVLQLDEAKRLFHHIETYPDYTVYVACIDDVVVGSFALLIMPVLGHLSTSSGIVEDVIVDLTLHRNGIGKVMMRSAMQICKEKHCYKLSLSTNLKRKDAHIFYESLGFEKHGYSFKIDLT